MKRYLTRSLGYVVAALLAIILVALLSVPRQVYVQLISSRLGAAFEESGVVIDFEGVNSSGLRTITAEKAVVLFTGPLITAELQGVEVSLNPLSLVRLRIQSFLNATAYGGALKASSSNSLFQDSGSFTAAGRDIKLESVPLLSFFGLTSGMLSFELSELSVRDGLVEVLALTFAIKDLEKGNETPALPITSAIASSVGIPFSGPIPPFAKVQVSGEATLQNSTLKLAEFTLNTPDGTFLAKGEAQLSAPLDRILSCDCRLEVSLTPQGLTSLGPLLPLVTKGKVNAKTGRFDVLLRGPASQENLEYSIP